MSLKKQGKPVVSQKLIEEMKKESKSSEVKTSVVVQKKIPFTQILSYVFLAMSFVATIALFFVTILSSNQIVEQLSSIIQVSILLLFSISFLFICLSASESKKGSIFVLVASFLFVSYSGFQLLEQTHLLNLPTQSYVENFTNRSLTEVMAWAQKNNVTVEQIFESSDTVKEYYVISQNITAGTLVKEIKTLEITVSQGPDKQKEVIFPNMIGKNVDQVIAFVEENFFTNIVIDFIPSDEEKDMIIEQDKSGQLSRDTEIKITASLGREPLAPVELENLVDRTSFYATTWLKRHGITYKIEYDYSNQITKGKVISQSTASGNMVTPGTDVVTLVISKGNKIIVPNLMSMDMESITAWVIENKLKIEFADQYDDTVALGKPISVNYQEGQELEEGALIKVVISKGTLKMEKFATPSEYRAWAEKYQISYKEDIEFSDSIPNGGIIRLSHQEGATIKNGDTIIVTVSQGKELTVPKLIGKSKSEAQKTCNASGLKCSFIYGGYSETIAKDIVTKQSKSEGSKVTSSTTVTITLSSGIIEKVNVPNFVGQTQSSIQSQCNNLGITCKFVTESTFSSIPAGNATRQSASGRMNKGSTITVYLSKGVAGSATITILEDWQVEGNPTSTYNNIKNSITKKISDINIVVHYESVTTGIGLILPKSGSNAIKVGPMTFTQGQTYHLYIGSN